MSLESERKKKMFKTIFNVVLIVILVVFAIFKIFGGESKEKVFKEVETAISNEKTIEDVKTRLGALSSEKGIQYRINSKDENSVYKIDIKYDEEIQSISFQEPSDKEKDTKNDTAKGETTKDETKKDETVKDDTQVKQSTDNTKTNETSYEDVINVDNILGSASDVEIKDNRTSTYTNEKSTDELEKAAEREKESKANELYSQVKFSLENNKVIDTLEDDLKDIAKEAKKKNISFAYSIKDKLEGSFVIVTEINGSTHRDNFLTEEAKNKEKESKN